MLRERQVPGVAAIITNKVFVEVHWAPPKSRDPNSHAPEKGNQVALFNGLAQVILQSQRAGSGSLVLRATSVGLEPAETTVNIRAVPAFPSVPVIAP